MKRLFRVLSQRFTAEEGQSMVEYALLIALLVIAALGIFVIGVAGGTENLYRNSLQRLMEAFGGGA